VTVARIESGQRAQQVDRFYFALMSLLAVAKGHGHELVAEKLPQIMQGSAIQKSLKGEGVPQSPGNENPYAPPSS
jgi:hypothetical protein